MKILLTGVTGYIGSRLAPLLLEAGHTVYALVRNKERIRDKRIIPVVGDFSKGTLSFPNEIDAAYYFIHSMARSSETFAEMDRKIARDFIESITKTRCKQIIYLTGLVHDQHLSKHLSSRKEVEEILRLSAIPVTSLHAGIIIGSGSASYEIIRDLVEKLPIMVAPRWVNNQCQPIAISDVLDYLFKVLDNPDCTGKSFDIGGPEVLSYKQMLLGYAKKRKLHRLILSVPFLTPRLSSYWLFFITSTSYPLAKALVDSLKNNAVCKNREITTIIPKQCLTYEEALDRAFQKIEENAVLSSWHDSLSSSNFPADFMKYVQVPTHGCYRYTTKRECTLPPEKIGEYIFNIGGKSGWYSMNWAWRIRGYIDRLLGGVGLRRGKTRRGRLQVGDALDFWRVLLVDEKNIRLLLYAEMKLPGEAWLELSRTGSILQLTATFRPIGLFGRLYWWVFYPIHWILFPGMLRHIVKQAEKASRIP